MTEYFKRYRSFVASCLEDKDCDFAKLLDYHKEHIAFFQHERLIHLIVTVLFALCTVMTFIAIAVWQVMILIPLAIAFLQEYLLYTKSYYRPFYIKHYYFLENQTQLLYKDYDKIYRRVHNFGLDNEKGVK